MKHQSRCHGDDLDSEWRHQTLKDCGRHLMKQIEQSPQIENAAK
jgi:hypothetical protein